MSIFTSKALGLSVFGEVGLPVIVQDHVQIYLYNKYDSFLFFKPGITAIYFLVLNYVSL